MTIPTTDTPTWPLYLLLLLLGLGWSFDATAHRHWDDAFGEATVRDRMRPHDSEAGKQYTDTVRPIIEQRCVVCHGCYDSPCQLNLSAAEGIDRGASPELVYDGTRLTAAQPTRLFIDAQTTEQWRQLGFFPVLNEHRQTPEANVDASVMHHMLTLKRDNPLPRAPLLPKSVTLGLDREQSCPKLEDIDDFMEENPLWGMPYGLPALADEDYLTLQQWLENGALMARPATLDPATQARVAHWEAFLNGDSLKQQLMSRYLYEHWFLAHLYFSEQGDGRFFRILRSSTPPGQPIAEIGTRRPYDDPGVERVYYRLWYDHSTVLDKTHMPYALNPDRMAWLEKLFLAPEIEVTALPSYATEVAANPFIAFQDIPVQSRWQFLLAEAQFTIMNFIKGPVCRGQIALNVIRDNFWVVFSSPTFDMPEEANAFVDAQEHNLRMPGQAGSNAMPFSTWIKYAHSQDDYLKAKSAALEKFFPDGKGLDIDLIWDGDGNNPNAALTVFRHFDSASVVKGLVGPTPETMWLVDYPILERIHYLLVAGFDVFGNVGHQLTTRLYMDFLRMESEFNFLLLLPPEERIKQREWWYAGASKKQKSYLFGEHANYTGPSGISYKTDDPKQELYGMIKQRLAPVLNHSYELTQADVPQAQREALTEMQGITGLPVAVLPEVVFLTVESKAGYHYYTLIHNRAHSNITSLLMESDNLRPEYDSLSVVKDFIGSYPDAHWLVQEEDLPKLVARMKDLGDEDSYAALMDRYGVRRTSPNFWEHSDRVMAAHKDADPIANGLLDYNRLENR